MDTGKRLRVNFDGQNLITGPHTFPCCARICHKVRGRPPTSSMTERPLHTYRGQHDLPTAARAASCFASVSQEDKTGIANAIVPPALFEQQRLRLSRSAFLVIGGWGRGSADITVEQVRSKLTWIAQGEKAVILFTVNLANPAMRRSVIVLGFCHPKLLSQMALI